MPLLIKFVIQNQSDMRLQSLFIVILFLFSGDMMAQTSIQRDVNHDGSVDISDIVAVINTIAGESTYVSSADVNKDENTDISDIVAIINHIAGTANYANADVNEDKTVDISDIVAVINIIANKEE